MRTSSIMLIGSIIAVRRPLIHVDKFAETNRQSPALLSYWTMTEPEALWKPASQAERLAELMSNDAQQKEAPLRRDVRSLGILLGRVLKEQGGDELFVT